MVMVIDDIWNLLEKKVFSLPSVKEKMPLFNPYNDNNPTVDLPNANEIRQENLRNYLRSFPKRPSVVLVGEAPGWRGCRFSGVPFTSEEQLCNGNLPFKGLQSSNKALPYKESTATIFWRHMSHHHPKFFAWNCIPFHPYKLKNLISNRTPIEEVSDWSWLLLEILSLIKPKQVIAVGRKAEESLSKIGSLHSYVRHPANGGSKNFKKGIEKIFGGRR